MGMASVPVYPRPRVKKMGYMWRVTWCSVHNQLWYDEFPTWDKAIKFAVSL